MASTLNPPPSVSNRQHAVSGPAVAPVSTAPAGTFVPGTKVQVGNHRVVIEKYLSEGGFAHVYLVRLPKPIAGDDTAVLKRVAVPDKENLANMRTEVETMKKLKGHRHIVTYMDSHASQLKNGGYEVFLLMEYCGGGGLIDFMNTRLQNRLTEPEILKIFSDVALGVATMHYLKPPLLHRDLKVENILISSGSSSKTYKLCDFGSTAPPRPAATSAAEGRLIEDDVQKHTTLQYRSPEMIDVYRKQPIDEKSDIWALGVLLYKLCYYTTPFEQQGQMAILNASFKFPGYPSFSDKLKVLIASMLREKPSLRPNIYQVVREVALIRGTDIPIQDIYATRTASEVRKNQHLPSTVPNIVSPPVVGAYSAPPTEDKTMIPEITPMRRGRPVKSTQDRSPRPSPSPLRSRTTDPFTALDSAPNSAPDLAVMDNAMNRFPPLEQFSILNDQKTKFAFDSNGPSSSVPSKGKDISQRVTQALADDAFAQPLLHSQSLPQNDVPSSLGSLNAKNLPSTKKTWAAKDVGVNTQPPTMVSTGTMTAPSPLPEQIQNMQTASRPIYRFPPNEAPSLGQPRASSQTRMIASSQSQNLAPSRIGPSGHRSNSREARAAKGSLSSRPSIERMTSSNTATEAAIPRSRSSATRPRPSSAYVDPTSRFGRTVANSVGRTSGEYQRPYLTGNEPLVPSTIISPSEEIETTKIDSNVEFLKAMEDEDPTNRKTKRLSSGSKHSKRSSMPSISLAGTKSLLAGRFGEAFRRFETNTNGPDASPSEEHGNDLTPIAGSEATDGRSDDGGVLEETEDLSPEVRREIERRRLSQEERRVAEGAAAYRRKLAEKGESGRVPSLGRTNDRATSIQNKVQALLDESGRASPQKTAEGYGKYTQQAASGNHSSDKPITPNFTNSAPRQPLPTTRNNKPIPEQTTSASLPVGRVRPPHASTDPVPSYDRPLQRTAAPPKPQPKPQALRTGGRGEPAAAEIPPVSHEDWEANFTKRYPKLSSIELVETDVEAANPRGMTVRDV